MSITTSKQQKDKYHNFTLALSSNVLTMDQIFDALECSFNANDATVSMTNEGVFVEFDRVASSFLSAVMRAVREVESVEHILADRLDETDLVTASEIANRVGRTRESIRLLANSTRGPGDFPQPVGYLDKNTRAWRWSDVSLWFSEHGEISENMARRANLIAAINAALQAKRSRERLPSKREQRAIATLVSEAGGKVPA